MKAKSITDTAASKRFWRRRLRAKRKSLPFSFRQKAARALPKHGRLLFLRHKKMGFYFPTPEEMDVGPLMRRALNLGKSIFLPALRRGARLGFYPYIPGKTTLKKNRFGILEPFCRKHPVKTASLDLIFLPLVGVDVKGRRLGMGKGYYDRAISCARKKPFLAGAAFEAQKVQELPADPWDVPLDALLTENGLYLFSEKKP